MRAGEAEHGFAIGWVGLNDPNGQAAEIGIQIDQNQPLVQRRMWRCEISRQHILDVIFDVVVAAYFLNNEIGTVALEQGTQVQPDATLEDTGAQLAQTQPGVDVRFAKR